MKNNKILYQPRTADPSTLTTDSLLTLANIFGISQPTISRAINTVLNILDIVLPPPPRPKDLRPQRLYVLDGTLVPCWWW
ncbi:transposase family protein, partial [Corynebacterium matruchotii]|uniref:transposase family protein n=1 Tax=Corynebacterium matruchotii TaxID=43768 RepID=UPI003C6F77E4